MDDSPIETYLDRWCDRLCEAIAALTEEERADIRRSLLARAKKDTEDRLLLMPVPTGRIQ